MILAKGKQIGAKSVAQCWRVSQDVGSTLHQLGTAHVLQDILCLFISPARHQELWGWGLLIHCLLPHWALNKMAAILQMTFSNEFLWMEIVLFWLKLDWSLWQRVQLKICQYWLRWWLATSHYLNKLWWAWSMTSYGNTKPHQVNLLAAGRCSGNFKRLIFKLIQNSSLDTHFEVALRQMKQNPP